MSDEPQLMSDERSNTTDRRQVGADDLEITDQMIDAGVAALREWLDTEDRFCGWDGLAVRNVFLAASGLFIRETVLCPVCGGNDRHGPALLQLVAPVPSTKGMGPRDRANRLHAELERRIALAKDALYGPKVCLED